MTISKDLFLSILSMDAYNRGYTPGIVRLGGQRSESLLSKVESK